jgi:hypothetical protein
MTENEQIAVVTFDSGRIALYDVKSSFSFIANVENGSSIAQLHRSIVLEK